MSCRLGHPKFDSTLRILSYGLPDALFWSVGMCIWDLLIRGETEGEGSFPFQMLVSYFIIVKLSFLLFLGQLFYAYEMRDQLLSISFEMEKS
jgi:hypothetical protein